MNFNRDEMDLDELVAAANELLPRHLPDAGQGRRQNLLNPRLVRHLASLGLIDEARRVGREARYGARHLRQLLAVRRLMADGLTTSAIKNLVGGAGDEQLEAILDGGARLAVDFPGSPSPKPVAQSQSQNETQNEAMRLIARIKARDAPESQPVAAAPLLAAPISSRQSAPRSEPTEPPSALLSDLPTAQNFARIEVWPGLELHLRDDFRAPTTPHERSLLLSRLEAALKNWKRKTR